MSKDIVKALVTKKFSEAKELVFQSLYAKTALAMDDARMGVASSVFNAPAEQVEEDVMDVAAKKATQKSLVKLADRATISPTGNNMRRWSVADEKATKRAASPTKYTAKGGRVIKVEEDVMDVAAKKATQKSLVKLADRATISPTGNNMRRWSVADEKATKRAASPTKYTAKGGRVIKAK